MRVAVGMHIRDCEPLKFSTCFADLNSMFLKRQEKVVDVRTSEIAGSRWHATCLYCYY